MLSEKGNQIKDQLKEFRQLKRKIQNLREEIQEILILGKIPKRSDYIVVLKKNVSNRAPQEGYVIKLEELQNTIEQLLEELSLKEKEILSSMEELDLLSYNMLMERYIVGKSVKEMSREFYYSERQIRRRLDGAMDKLSKKQ